jgi:hypothetical protein
VERDHFSDEIARRDSAVTAIRHVLRGVAEGRYRIPSSVLCGLGAALDDALEVYAREVALRDEGNTANAV